MSDDRPTSPAATTPLRVRTINALRVDALRHGIRLGSDEEVLAYGLALSEHELARIRNIGRKALDWLREQRLTAETATDQVVAVAHTDRATGRRVALRVGRATHDPGETAEVITEPDDADAAAPGG